MNRSGITVAIVAVGASLAFAAPTPAQIASYVDASGKIVYVNGDSPVRRRGSTISSATVSARFLDASYGKPAATPPDRLDRIVSEAAARHDLDPALVKAVISTESGWNPQAVSRKGAVGLMQLIPATAQRYGANNPFDPAQNIEAGTTYLRSLLDRYDGDLTKSLAAYNAGERAVDYSRGLPAYRETRQYVRKVTDAYFRPGSGRQSSLWSPPKDPVRRVETPNGRVVFTNE